MPGCATPGMCEWTLACCQPALIGTPRGTIVSAAVSTCTCPSARILGGRHRRVAVVRTGGRADHFLIIS